jgi:hypothetical protein
MRSWVFRHRHRLRTVYGLPEPRDPSLGRVERKGRFVIVRPLPRRVG